MKGKRIVVIVVVLIAALAAAAYLLRDHFRKPGVRVLETGRVEKGDIRGVLVETGVIKSQVGAVVKIGARATGKVERMLVKVGDRVTAGQLIARIDDRETQKTIDQARAALQTAEGTLAQVRLTYPERIREAEAAFTYARIAFEREQALLAREYTTKDALDRAESQFHAAGAVLRRTGDEFESQQRILAATIRELTARLQAEEIRLGYARIHAPISGVVSDVTAQEGETVVAGLQVANLVTVVDPSRLEMWIYIDETDIGRAKTGQAVEYTVDTFPERTFRGRIERINPQPVVKENIVYYLATLRVAPDDARFLRPEMTTRVKIVTVEKRGVLTVPNAAIKFERGEQIAYRVVDGPELVERTALELGIRGEERTEIVAGPPEGAVLATRIVLPVAPEPDAPGSADGKRR